VGGPRAGRCRSSPPPCRARPTSTGSANCCSEPTGCPSRSSESFSSPPPWGW
jgi:hypothetical protein